MSFSKSNVFWMGLVAALLFLTNVSFAQIREGDLQLQSASGNLQAGYGGQIDNEPGEEGSSSHDLGLGGNVSTGGYYYNPNFLSFNSNLYYDRAQSNAGSTSIGTAKGYITSAQIFGGSSTPGSIAFSQGWGNNGAYGLGGLSGLNSSSYNRDFSVAWTFKNIPLLPNLSLTYTDSDTNVSIPGIELTDSATTHTYGAGVSGYHFAGFTAGFGYEHLHTTDLSNLADTDTGPVSGSTSLNMFRFFATRALPWHSKLTLSAFRTTSTSESAGDVSRNTTDELDATIQSHVWRLPLSGSISYNDDVYGSLLQELDASGQTVPVSTTSPRIGNLLMNVSTSYGLPHGVFVTAFASRQEEFLPGGSVGATQFGANASYAFGKYLKGLTVIVGMHDSASQAGNNGAGLLATASYVRSLGTWRSTSYVSYNQSVQTMLALYTMSTISASTSLRRDLSNGLRFYLTGGYGRSVFEQNSGASNQSETLNAGISWLRQTLSGSYGSSSGTVIVTSAGLVPVTTPGVTALPGISNVSEPFSGRSYTAGYSNTVVKNLSVAVGWTRFQSSNTGSLGVLSGLSTEQYNGYLTYNWRKLNFLASATRLNQGSNNTSSLPSRVTVYYFGVSRWLNFF